MLNPTFLLLALLTLLATANTQAVSQINDGQIQVAEAPTAPMDSSPSAAAPVEAPPAASEAAAPASEQSPAAAPAVEEKAPAAEVPAEAPAAESPAAVAAPPSNATAAPDTAAAAAAGPGVGVQTLNSLASAMLPSASGASGVPFLQSNLTSPSAPAQPPSPAGTAGSGSKEAAAPWKSGEAAPVEASMGGAVGGRMRMGKGEEYLALGLVGMVVLGVVGV